MTISTCFHCHCEFRTDVLQQIPHPVTRIPVRSCGPCANKHKARPTYKKSKAGKIRNTSVTTVSLSRFLDPVLSAIDGNRSKAISLSLNAYQQDPAARVPERELTALYLKYPTHQRRKFIISLSLNDEDMAALLVVGDGNRSLGVERVLLSAFLTMHRAGRTDVPPIPASAPETPADRAAREPYIAPATPAEKAAVAGLYRGAPKSPRTLPLYPVPPTEEPGEGWLDD